ncbi:MULTISPECIES: glycoside hydrolase family 3 C-terminal domain-containing protein [Clostridium]|uniref:Glycoside hydrolase family 3 C-terminal domain-containing protein n=1 Tax=Clostridium cibarium TaxID=2762247 RepID=A0ABR8PP24_9CLOT|nr:MULTISPECIES: glycoside hydrolase family 3 C-terminal domain-containing protein [Clostridium]MBD7909927.1 glycoside hydrolase family 3 C-terminal domain-containing protein [Clostridium cibarium]
MRKRTKILVSILTTISTLAMIETVGFAADTKSELAMLTDEASIPKVISEMTLDEKCQMVCGIGLMTPYGGAGATFAIPRLGIPSVELTDGPQGVRMGGLVITPNYAPTKYATCFPNPLLNASTWSPELINKVGKAMAEECRSYGADVLLAPAMNIIRDPLGGRTFEYYSEDPYVTGVLGTEAVKGIQSQGIGACIKHFACNNQENNRIDGDEIISDRALREIYLPQYEKATKEANPWSAMASYNKVNGTRMTENKYLMEDVLRGEFGFDGMIMSDWGAYNRAEAFKAGLDMNQPGGFYNMSGILLPAWLMQIKPAVTSWNAIKESDLDRAITNILKLIIKTPTFKGEYGDKEKFKNKTTLSTEIATRNQSLSRELAAEGIVLLKNQNNTLPIRNNKIISVAGKNAFDNRGIIYEGNGSATVNADPKGVVSLTQGLKNAGFSVISKFNNKNIVEGISTEGAANLAATTDSSVISIGLPGHEGSDYGSMSLSKDQISLIKTLGDEYHKLHKKVVVVLNTGAPVEVSSWEQYADSILWVGLPGSEGANAIGDIIKGAVNPSGKLTVTWPVNYYDVPDSSYFPKNTNTPVNYKEGIYVGYRYYDTKNVAPLYRFGYGLSYTTFKYSNIKLSSDKFYLNDDNSRFIVSVDITNTGNVAGKEVAQLYIKDVQASVDRPEKELKGFVKTRVLNPGETQTAEFSINKRDLSFYSENNKAWVQETGEFNVIVGGTSDDKVLQSEGEKAKFNALN